MSSQPPRNAQHCLNPLHVYCRLRDMGLPGPVARSVSSGYERLLYRPLAGHPSPTTARP